MWLNVSAIVEIIGEVARLLLVMMLMVVVWHGVASECVVVVRVLCKVDGEVGLILFGLGVAGGGGGAGG